MGKGRDRKKTAAWWVATLVVVLAGPIDAEEETASAVQRAGSAAVSETVASPGSGA